ncbi:MAG: cyclic nucleotide-binding protein [Oceanospirillaceae bacterium]|nr:cyclic nucleotide-binding protein [Oceanospirillaceae bacterium]|tara:strand:- start:44175 stop:45971 length:1797 start_codon:yes stop_codon:yes gene_type:complete
MTIQINLNQPPFSFLSDEQLEWLTSRLDLVFFPQGAVILDEGDPAPGIYIVYKGIVEETDSEGTIFSQYGNEDVFDVRAVLETACKHRYTAMEETLCYLLKAKDFVQLLEESNDFSIYFKTDLGTQEQLVDQRETGVSEFILSRIDEDTIRSPVYVTGQTSLARVAALMREQKHDAILVRTAKKVGIVTGTDLLRATLLGDMTKQTKVADIANYNLIDVTYGDFLFNALLKMTQHGIERVVVRQDGDIIGMLELMDMLSLFSTHSHVIAMRIEQAKTMKELVVAARRLETLINNLFTQGVKVVAIMELITTLNRRLMQRAYDLIFPERLRNSICILVLGSEGRGEQILKTDQDNAVILENEHDREAVLPLLQRLHEAFLDFGYPPCPGGVMFISDSWIDTGEGWQNRVNRWLSSAEPEPMMNMAIFMDAEPVCGNPELFKPVKASWQKESLRSSITSAWFARPALQFETPLTFLGKIREDHGSIDIKKGGIFPLVHGVRALSFEYGINECNTLARLEILQGRHVLDEEIAQGLKDALLLFLRIRLRQQLQSHSDNPGLSQQLKLNSLRSVDRSLLRHALHRVKKFKQFLINHYHLESF